MAALEHRGSTGPRQRPWRVRLAVILQVYAWLLVLAGCAGETVRLPVPLQGDYVVLTRPIIMLGDTQEHEATGFPLHNSDGAVDVWDYMLLIRAYGSDGGLNGGK